MAKSMNIKNGGSTKPLVPARKEKPMITAYRQSPFQGLGDKQKSPLNIVTNKVSVGDSHRLQKAIKVPGRIKSTGKPGFFK